MDKKRIIRLAVVILSVMMPLFSATVAFGAPENSNTESDFSTKEKYASPDINKLTGHGEEPEELSVSAGATYQEKAWYEYVMYSEHAVSSYRVDDDTRLLFYDPYTYTNSLIMDVQFDANTTEFDTMSSYTISYTKSKTIATRAESTYTNTSATQISGTDHFGSSVTNTGKSKTNYNHSTDVETQGTVTETERTDYYYRTDTLHTLCSSLASETAVELSLTGGVTETVVIEGGDSWSDAMNTDYTESSHDTTYSDDYKTSTKTTGYDDVEYNNTSETTGWTELSDRITKTLGSSISTSSSWSETESTTVSKTYAATHFASDGITPLPWAIVHYQVQMPMKVSMQVKYSGEWITVSTVYCLLTTVQGTCRAWMQQGQVYYEDWGNGEPVVATDFWSQFTTKENLIKAYNDKLYPVGGEN